MNQTIRRKIWTGKASLLWMILLTACLPSQAATPTRTPDTGLPAPIALTWTPLPTEADRWSELLEHTPVPWTTPLPPLEPSILDGIYVKDDPTVAQWWVCRRCPEYRSGGGIWRLELDRGVFRIYYTVSGWRSLGSYTVDGDRLLLFNDPMCQWDTGVYTWQLDDGQLRLTEVDDPCSTSFHLRAANLTQQGWQACPSPAADPAAEAPPGCPTDPS
jgi:hypothetical protein